MPCCSAGNGKKPVNTGVALQHASQLGFQYARQNAAKVVLLVTSGKSNDGLTEAVTVACFVSRNALRVDVTRCRSQALKELGAAIYAIGVSSAADGDELGGIVSEPIASHMLFVNAYDNLVDLQPRLARALCNGVLDSLGNSNIPHIRICFKRTAVVFISTISLIIYTRSKLFDAAQIEATYSRQNLTEQRHIIA